ncbi:molybdate ABC transporter permease subunit [soil metagenome]
MLDPARLSLYVMAVAVPGILIFGTALGVFFARTRFRGRTILETMVMLPLVLPPSVVGYALLRFMGRNGPVQNITGINLLFTWQAAAVASMVVALPLMLQAARIGVSAVDRAVEEAAKVDGASRMRVLFTMTLPLARRGIAIGLALGSARALGEFGATLAVAGSIPGRTQTMPLAVYDAMQRGDYRVANWISFGMVAFGFVAILVSGRLAADPDQ